MWQKGMPPVCNADSFQSDWLHPVLPCTTDPWTVALNLCTWNGKACFPAENLRYKYKLKGLKELIQKKDIVLLQETHFASRSVASVRRLCTSLGCVLFAFARGQAAGGVAAIAKRSFLEHNFSGVEWTETIASRIGCLQCYGPNGNLQLFSTHMFAYLVVD